MYGVGVYGVYGFARAEALQLESNAVSLRNRNSLYGVVT